MPTNAASNPLPHVAREAVAEYFQQAAEPHVSRNHGKTPYGEIRGHFSGVIRRQFLAV
jgi:hypothetical protein